MKRCEYCGQSEIEICDIKTFKVIEIKPIKHVPDCPIRLKQESEMKVFSKDTIANATLTLDEILNKTKGIDSEILSDGECRIEYRIKDGHLYILEFKIIKQGE